jgi:hypothetical protein
VERAGKDWKQQEKETGLRNRFLDTMLRSVPLQVEGDFAMTEAVGFYRHVVLFRFKPEASAAAIEAAEEGFRALCAELPFVKGFEWGRNSSPEKLDDGYTHCFIVSFASPADRDAYLPHPAHQSFIRTRLEGILDKVCVVDFHAMY